MHLSFLTLHRHLFGYLALTIILTVVIAVQLGEFKAATRLDWIDAMGEGGITLMTLIWIFFTLVSRPAGRVTNWLFVGLTFTHVSMLLDFLDEFIAYPADSTWLTTVESLPAPVGMIIMTLALYRWHQEQHAINSQLRRTERYYREHSLTDFITGLYSAEYMKRQLQSELHHARSSHATFSLMLLDIKEFTAFNQQYGPQHGDNLLREIAQLIRMNIRDGDLACRYASDRFIVLLPHSRQATASQIAVQVARAISHLAYKPGRSSEACYPAVVTCVRQYQGWHRYQDILAALNNELLMEKSRTASATLPGQPA